MDAFDDLLAPSRRALEDNPFANPFSSDSSHSSDPWASPFASSHHSDDVFGSTMDPYANPYESSPTSPTTQSQPHEEVHEEIRSKPVAIEESPLNDPLDSSVLNDDDEDNKPPTRSGFTRYDSSADEGSSFNETATIRPTEPEKFDGSPILPTEHGLPSVEEKKPEDKHDIEASSKATSGFIAHTPIESTTPVPSTPGVASDFGSPLNSDGFGLGLDRSMAGLSLGAEALVGGRGSGWEAEQDGWGGHSEPIPSTSTIASPFTPTKPKEEEEDSDDDKPISQTLNRIQNEDPDRAKGKLTIQPVFSITVDDPQKVGDPIRSYTMYTVHTRTNSPLYQKSSFSVLRRYSDFRWLYDTLQMNNPGVVVPPVPEKNTFGRFDDAFVKQRRLSLEKCVQKMANHPVLAKDPDLKFFLESDNFSLDMKHRKAEAAHEKGGLIASIGQSLAGPRFHETDEWFDRQKGYLDSLESQLKGLVKAIEIVAKQRAELATVTGEFAQSISDIAVSDIGAQLSQSLSGLAEVEKKAQQLQIIQSDQDMVTILATADEYSRLINSVRLAFSSRIRVYHQWKNSESELLRIKRTHEKNRAQGQIPADKLSYTLQQIAEAERRASESKLEWEQVSKLVKQEVARFEQERIDDFKDSLHAFLEGMILRQKDLIATWERYQQVLLKKATNSTVTPTITTSS